jgi:hypothetical protein
MIAAARSLLLALGLFAVSAPAYAQVAPAVDVSSWAAVDYNDYVLADDDAVTAAFGAYATAMGTRDLDQMYYARLSLKSTVEGAMAKVSDVPAYNGDSSLRDATLVAYAFYSTAVQDSLPRLEVMIAQGDFVGAQALVDEMSADEQLFAALLDATQEEFAARWGFTLAGDTSLVADTSYATDSTYTYEEPEVYVEEDEPTYVSFWGALDRGLQDDMKGWSLGYDSAIAPKLTSGLSWRHQDVGASVHDRVELVVSPTIVSMAGEEVGLYLNARAGAGYAWGDGQKGWGASVGGEAELGLPGPLYAFVRADRGFWGGDLKDELSGWEAQAGVGATLKI